VRNACLGYEAIVEFDCFFSLRSEKIGKRSQETILLFSSKEVLSTLTYKIKKCAKKICDIILSWSMKLGLSTSVERGRVLHDTRTHHSSSPPLQPFFVAGIIALLTETSDGPSRVYIDFHAWFKRRMTLFQLRRNVIEALEREPQFHNDSSKNNGTVSSVARYR